MGITVDRIDHFVLTVVSIEKTADFYSRVLGMQLERFGTPDTPRFALTFGNQKINLHQADRIPDPNVLKPTPGAGDFCLIAQTPIEDIQEHLVRLGVDVVEGPVTRTGAQGPIRSIYIRDPDLNLVEISNYPAA